MCKFNYIHIYRGRERYLEHAKKKYREKKMASRPGPFTHWPWQKLGNMKYVVLVPWLAHSLHKFMEGERDTSDLVIFPTLLLKLLHGQLWITLSRFQTARSKRRIVDKSLEFEQVDRERNWDDQVVLTGLVLYAGRMIFPGASHMPWWDAKGVAIVTALHMGPVEFIYYWLHRALHHHFLYSRYHSHHHASIVTEPITSVIHPFAEEVAYFLLFSIPLGTIAALGVMSVAALVGYLTYIDFMNYMGHCNFELVPRWLFQAFPPLKYLMYTPSFHSLHHTQFRTNYCLFMPLYDYVYGTVDDRSDELYERSLVGEKLQQQEEEELHVVHLTHLTTVHSIFHTRLGLASLSSKPYAFKWWHLWVMWPFTCASTLLTRLLGSAFVVMERNRLKKLQMETWSITRYGSQYASCDKERINSLIEKAILEADARGSKVVTLGLLNQGEMLNEQGMIYVKRNPKLRTVVVDGTGLAVAVVVNTVPKEASSVLLIGNPSKMAFNVCFALCLKGVKVEMVQGDEYNFLKLKMPAEIRHNLVLSDRYESKVWLIGGGVSDTEQRKARKGVSFVPFSQFPPRAVRKDCSYHTTPAMVVPKAYENLHTCENWLPRRVISAWRVAGIIHALEGWSTHECGDAVTNIEKAWNAALHHGFSPFKA